LFLVFRLIEDTFTPFYINAEMPPEKNWPAALIGV
jgi:hypothetical protein